MLRTLYAAVLVAATIAIPALWPQDAQAQFVVGGPRSGVVVGQPYYGGYNTGFGYTTGYGNGYYNGYNNNYYNSNNAYYGGSRYNGAVYSNLAYRYGYTTTPNGYTYSPGYNRYWR